MTRDEFEKNILQEENEIESKLREIRLVGNSSFIEEVDKELEDVIDNALYCDENIIDQADCIARIHTINRKVDSYMNKEWKKDKTDALKNEILQVFNFENDDNLMEKIMEVKNKWSNIRLSPIEQKKLNEQFANSLLEIYKYQIGKNQAIDLSSVDKICSNEVFVEVFKNELSKIAYKNNDNELSLDEITIQDLKNSKYWEVLTGNNNIQIKKDDIADTQKNELMTVQDSKISFLSKKLSEILNKILRKISNRKANPQIELKPKTKLYYGIVNNETGQYDTKYTKDLDLRSIEDDDLNEVLNKAFDEKLILFPNCQLIGIEIDDEEDLEKFASYASKPENDKMLQFFRFGDSIEKVPQNLFRYVRLRNCYLGKNIQTIGEYAFACNFMKTIEMPDSVENIEEGAFANCYQLKIAKLGNSLKTIGESAFEECPLEFIKISNSVESIGKNAFRYCSHMKEAELGYSLKTIGESAFERCPINYIIIPNSVESIEKSAFERCNLNRVILGANVKNIGIEAFYHTNIGKIIVPDLVESIGDRAFGFCNNLKSVQLGKNVKEICTEAFEHTNIESMEIPNSVRTIKDYAFANCNNLKRIVFEGDIKDISLGKLDDDKRNKKNPIEITSKAKKNKNKIDVKQEKDIPSNDIELDTETATNSDDKTSLEV
jgi:hypothetical protein